MVRPTSWRQWPWRWSQRSTAAFFVACAILVAVFDGAFFVRAPLGGFDWPKERFFYAALRSHLRAHGTPPIAFATLPPAVQPQKRSMPTLQHSSSYLGNPEVLTFSPLLPLLAFVSVSLFVRLYFVAHLLAGAFGLWLLARRARLPPWAALLLFALTMLNPWVVQHLAIGYSPHITYALVPLVVALLVAERWSLADFIAACLVEGLIVFEGGLHLFNWLNGALLIFALALRQRALLARVGLLFAGSALVCAPKLAVVLQALGGWPRPAHTGIMRAGHLWGLLTDGDGHPFQLPQAYRAYSTDLFDGAIYVGTAFVALMAIALVLALRRRDRRALALAAVAALFVVCACGPVWRALTHVLRPLEIEIYPYRFLFVALTALIGLTVLEAAQLVERGGRWRWLPLLFIPTLLAMWVRTQEYVAQTNLPVPPDCSEAILTRQLEEPRAALASDGKELPTRVQGETFVIDTTGKGRVRLPWLQTNRAEDLEIEGASVVDADLGTGLLLTPTASQIRVSPSSYHFWPIAVPSWAAFVALAWLLQRRQRRQRRGEG